MPAQISPESFEKFVQERKYLHNVSSTTEQIYRAAWAKWEKYGPDPVAFVAGMREGGMNATGCNIYIRSMNAFFNWAEQPSIRKLKEEEKVHQPSALPTSKSFAGTSPIPMTSGFTPSSCSCLIQG
jgi:hypothetical protein